LVDPKPDAMARLYEAVFASVPRSGVDNTPIEIYQTGRIAFLTAR
jgi:hypothetical protein